MTEDKPKQGFARLTPERRREIAARGGRAAHAKGVAHKFKVGDPLAKSAGRKGGLIISADRQHMAIIGSKGGAVRRETVVDLKKTG